MTRCRTLTSRDALDIFTGPIRAVRSARVSPKKRLGPEATRCLVAVRAGETSLGVPEARAGLARPRVCPRRAPTAGAAPAVRIAMPFMRVVPPTIPTYRSRASLRARLQVMDRRQRTRLRRYARKKRVNEKNISRINRPISMYCDPPLTARPLNAFQSPLSSNRSPIRRNPWN